MQKKKGDHSPPAWGDYRDLMGGSLVVDGNWLTARAAFALPETIVGPDRLPVNAAFGFLSQFLQILSFYMPDRVVVAFDADGPSFRHLALSAYKSGRVALPDGFKRQLAIVREILHLFQIPNLSADPYEADDIIATVVSFLADAVTTGKILIVSGDKDLLQLVDSARILVLSPKRGVRGYAVYDGSAVFQRTGVEVGLYVEFAAICGDASDNLGGIPGVGPKTAARLLRCYGSIEGIYDNIDDLSPSLKRSFESHRVIVERNVAMMTLVRDVSIELGEIRFRPADWDMKMIYSRLKDLGLGALTKSVENVKSRCADIIVRPLEEEE